MIISEPSAPPIHPYYIAKVEKADGNIVIHTEKQDPDPDDMVAEVITYPYDLTVIDYQGLPVRFE